MNKKTVTISIAAMCIVATLMLSVAAGIFPGLSVLFTLAVSVCMSYCYIRCGRVSMFLNLIIVSGVMFVLGGGEWDIMLIAALGIIPGIVSGFMQRKKSDYYVALCGVCLAFAATLMGLMYYSTLGIEGGIGGMLNMTAENIKASSNLFAGMGNDAAEDFAYMIDYMVSYAKMVFPSFVIVISMVLGYIHLVLLDIMARRMSGINLSYVRLDMHKTPKSMTYVYFIITIFLLFIQSGSRMEVVLQNIVVVLDTIMAFCGFSFIEYIFKRRIKYGFVRAFIYVAVFAVANSLAIQILSIIGMLDSFMNYRRIRKIGE